MSSDEGFVFLVCIVLAAVGWGWYYLHTFSATMIGSVPTRRGILNLTPLLCLVLLFIILKLFASHDVRDDGTYLAFYLLMGAAWIPLAMWLLPLVGFDPRRDPIHRRNPAAIIAIVGVMIGLTLCFAGGNIGDGPGWWVVLFAAVLSTGSLLLLWALVEGFTDLSDAITIDRDIASALRLAGFLVACGAILGRAVAGNWVSADETISVSSESRGRWCCSRLPRSFSSACSSRRRSAPRRAPSPAASSLPPCSS
jgi:hypothetical protein